MPGWLPEIAFREFPGDEKKNNSKLLETATKDKRDRTKR